MRASLLTLLLTILCAATPAHADRTIGIVATGDPVLQAEVAAYVDKWLRQQGHEVMASPLSPDAVNTIVNCFVLGDVGCARGVIDARSKATSVIYVQVTVDGKATTFTVHWFIKGGEPHGDTRACDKCNATAWHDLVDVMLDKLAAKSKVVMGRLVLSSDPPGLIALVDDEKVGETPIERELPAGKHTITLRSEGRTVAVRAIEIRGGETAEIAMRAEGGAVPERGGKLVPALLLGSGLATIAAGGVFLYYGTLGGADDKYIYPDSTPVGIALAAVGAGATIGGMVLLIRAGSSTSSGPVAAVGSGGGFVGWKGRF